MRSNSVFAALVLAGPPGYELVRDHQAILEMVTFKRITAKEDAMLLGAPK